MEALSSLQDRVDKLEAFFQLGPASGEWIVISEWEIWRRKENAELKEQEWAAPVDLSLIHI